MLKKENKKSRELNASGKKKDIQEEARQRQLARKQRAKTGKKEPKKKPFNQNQKETYPEIDLQFNTKEKIPLIWIKTFEKKRNRKCKNLIKQIELMEDTFRAEPLNVKDIILCQRELTRHKFPQIPNDFLELLHHFNGINFEDGIIYGINHDERIELDILIGNKQGPFQEKQKLILGKDEFDYLSL